MSVSNKGANIAESMTLAIDAKAKAMQAQGIDVIGFGAGEPDYDTPSYIKEAAKVALDKGLTKYTPVPGTMELRKAICEKFKNQNGLSYSPAEIVVSNGAKHSLFNVFQCILNPGDEVLVPAPYWVSYPEMIKMADGVPVLIDSTETDGFVPSIEAIEKAVTKKTKAILINSPGNPCGNVLSRELIESIAEIAEKNDAYIVSDEIYEELIYDGAKHFSAAQISPEIKNRTIVVNGFSKSFAMTGWRLGYTASNAELAKAMSNYQSHSTSNPVSFAQYAAVVALEGDKSEQAAMVKEFSERRDLMFGLVNKIPLLSAIKPKGAFYFMFNIGKTLGKCYNGITIDGSLAFCDALLQEQHVAVVPGIAFGADRYVRLSYATSRKNIEEGLRRIGEFVGSLT